MQGGIGKCVKTIKDIKINVAYNLIETVLGDTDMDSFAFNELLNALGWLEDWFEEEDI